MNSIPHLVNSQTLIQSVYQMLDTFHQVEKGSGILLKDTNKLRSLGIQTQGLLAGSQTPQQPFSHPSNQTILPPKNAKGLMQRSHATGLSDSPMLVQLDSPDPGNRPLEMAVSQMPICWPQPQSLPNPQIAGEAEILVLHQRAPIAPTPFGIVSPACLRDPCSTLCYCCHGYYQLSYFILIELHPSIHPSIRPFIHAPESW